MCMKNGLHNNLPGSNMFMLSERALSTHGHQHAQEIMNLASNMNIADRMTDLIRCLLGIV